MMQVCRAWRAALYGAPFQVYGARVRSPLLEAARRPKWSRGCHRCHRWMPTDDPVPTDAKLGWRLPGVLESLIPLVDGQPTFRWTIGRPTSDAGPRPKAGPRTELYIRLLERRQWIGRIANAVRVGRRVMPRPRWQIRRELVDIILLPTPPNRTADQLTQLSGHPCTQSPWKYWHF